jgi:hypothetical protein
LQFIHDKDKENGDEDTGDNNNNNNNNNRKDDDNGGREAYNENDSDTESMIHA